MNSAFLVEQLSRNSCQMVGLFLSIGLLHLLPAVATSSFATLPITKWKVIVVPWFRTYQQTPITPSFFMIHPSRVWDFLFEIWIECKMLNFIVFLYFFNSTT